MTILRLVALDLARREDPARDREVTTYLLAFEGVVVCARSMRKCSIAVVLS